MGITQYSIEKLSQLKGLKTVTELGSQNLFCDWKMGAYASEWYLANGFEKYTCIDLNGENNAQKLDLSQPLPIGEQVDLVTDFGTSEHVHSGNHVMDWKAIYNCWKTKHSLVKVGGYMVNENPKTGNWVGHGYNYYTTSFYLDLAPQIGYEIVLLEEHPAMGNTTDGWNVVCILKKVKDAPFIKLSEFKKLDLQPK